MPSLTDTATRQAQIAMPLNAEQHDLSQSNDGAGVPGSPDILGTGWLTDVLRAGHYGAGEYACYNGDLADEVSNTTTFDDAWLAYRQRMCDAAAFGLTPFGIGDLDSFGTMNAGSGGLVNRNAQLACAWSGPVMVVIWVVSFVVLAGFIPPPAPLRGEAEILQMFTDHAVPIRLGLIMTLFASALLVPWSAVIAVQMSRIEGKRPVLAITQVAQASLLSLEFIIPLMVWQTAAYRPSPERIHLIYMLNDMGWLMFVGVISSAVLQCLTLGVVILMDKREQPIFPRWTGYLALWTALLLAPAGVVPLFKEGALAWNGIFGFWIPLSIFCVWVSATTWYLIAAIKRESDEETAEQRSAALA